jgi:hypothetical protein
MSNDSITSEIPIYDYYEGGDSQPIPDRTEIVRSTRRADRALLGLAGAASVMLVAGVIAAFALSGSTTTASPAGPSPQSPTATPVVLNDAESADAPADTPADDPADAPLETPLPAPVEAAGDEVDAPVVSEPEPEPEPADEPEGLEEPEPEPQPTACKLALEDGKRFAVEDKIVLGTGFFNGSFFIENCTDEAFKIEIAATNGVLLGFDEMELPVEGIELGYGIQPDMFDANQIDVKIKVYQVDCCAKYVDIHATKPLELGLDA